MKPRKDVRILNLMIHKSGSGSLSSRLCIPMSWAKHMGLNIENKQVEVSFDYELKEIKIKKLQKQEL